MQQSRPYVAIYIKERIAQGKSAWTIQRDRSALRKIFKDTNLASEIKVPKRRIKNIKRSRLSVAMDKTFNPDRYCELVDFSKAFGLRRHELAAIRSNDIYWKDGKLIAFVGQGKGGKAREVTVVAGMEERVLDIIQGRYPCQPIFSYIPSRMDVHSYRSEYAQTRLVDAEELDVSRDLGHNRVDVIRGHYSGKR
jgi:integrase